MDPAVQSGGQLKTIFDSFDLDKSGTIEIKELGSVAAKLGKEIPPEQLASMVKNLDSNKDGKISYGEFEYWWSKGIEGKMMELVYLKSQALKLTNFVKKKAEQLGISFEGHKGREKPDKYSIKFNFGSEVKNSITFDAGVYVGGQKQAQFRQNIKKYAPDTSEKTFGILMRLPSKNAPKSKAALDHMLNSVVKGDLFPFKVENMEDNNFFNAKTVVMDSNVIVKIKFQSEIQAAVSPMSTQAQSLINQIGKGFYSTVDCHFSLNATIEQLLAEPVLNNVLKGFTANLLIEANNSALAKVRKFGEKQKMELPPFFNLLTLFRCAKFHLGIKSPDQLSAFFKKLGIEDLVSGLPNLKDLLQELTPVMKQAMEQQPMMKLVYKLSRYAFDYVQNEVEVFIMLGSLAVGYIRVQAKNASKLHSVIFNES